jgi:ABC-type sugar transport system substrate-binding protein
VILYNMVAGRLPFDTSSSDLVSIIYQHLEKPPTPPSEFNPDCPPQVEDVVLKSLQKDRDQRYASADEMARALNVALGRPGSSDSISTPIPRYISTQTRSISTRTSATRRNWMIGGAVAVLLIALVAAVLLIQNINAANQLALTQTAEAAAVTSQAVALNQTATAAAVTPTSLPPPTIEMDKRGPASDVVPSAEEISMVKTRLGDKGFIAYIACNQDSEFHAGLAREMNDLAKQYRLPFRIYDSETDAYREITQIERARSDGAAALVICPLDAQLLSATFASAQNAGLPLVFFADNIPNHRGILVGGDNYLLGLEPGRFAGKIIASEKGGKANVIVLDYPDREDIVARANGLVDGVLEYAPDATIVGRYKGATREFGKESVSKLINEGVKFDVIVSINDAGAFGAIEAMEEAGIKPDQVIVASIDAEALAQQYISEGYFMRGSVQSSRVENAHALLDAAVKLLAGGTLPEFVLVPPGPIITKESLETATPEEGG